MTATTAEATSLITFALPGTPYSVQMARFYVQAALAFHDLDDLSADAAEVASELVTNANSPSIGLEVMRLEHSQALAVVVAVIDSSPHPPVMRDAREDDVHGRGLHIVAALSDSWNWARCGERKAVYAIFLRKR